MKLFLGLMVAAMSLGLFFACRKTYPTPVKVVIGNSGSITIAGLRALQIGYLGAAPFVKKFTTDLNLYGVVTMDESSGNIYKQVYLRDYSGTKISSTVSLPYGAIVLKLINPGGLFFGDSIRLDLKGCSLDIPLSGGYLQVDSVNVGTMVVKIKTGLNPLPLPATIKNINTPYYPYLPSYTNTQYPYDGQLIKLSNVEFAPADTGAGKYYGVLNPVVINTNFPVQDCNGNSVIAFTSGYANYAAPYAGAPGAITIPGKSGTMVAISSFYGSSTAPSMELSLHSYAEINLTNSYCGGGVRDSLKIMFDSTGLQNNKPVNEYNWYNIVQVGNVSWVGLIHGSQSFPSASTYGSTDARNVMWLITPPILYDSPKTLSFMATTYYNSANVKQLDVFISTNFNNTTVNVNQANWQNMDSLFPLIPNLANGYAFKPCSNAPVPLSTFLPANYTGTFSIGFRYQGTISDPDSTATFGIDNVIIH